MNLTQEVIDLIDSEMAVQEMKGLEDENLGALMLKMEIKLRNAQEAWFHKGDSERHAMNHLRRLAGLVARTLLTHEVPPRF